MPLEVLVFFLNDAVNNYANLEIMLILAKNVITLKNFVQNTSITKQQTSHLQTYLP